LMVRFNGEKIAHLMQLMKTPPEMPLESRPVSRAIRSAQSNVEALNFEIRKDVLKYDDVMNRQRKVVYDERRQVLEGADLQPQIDGMIDDVINEYVAGATAEGFPEEWDLDKLWRALKQLYPIHTTIGDLVEEAGGERAHLTREQIAESVKEDAHAAYARREQEFTPEVMRDVERRIVLSVLDRKWREHLYEMDYLREGITLRGYGQRDPLVEYQREGYDMFTTMMDGIKEESVGNLFNFQFQSVQDPIMAENGAVGPVSAASSPQIGVGAAPVQPAPVQPAPAPIGQAQPGQQAAQPAAQGRGRHAQPARNRQGGQHALQRGQQGQQRVGQQQVADGAEGGDGTLPAGLARGLARPQRAANLSYSAPSDDASGRAQHVGAQAGDGSYAGVGRNAPCPCGSGKKFKMCHGDPRNR
ncbi:MAG TPA: SEC-C metal-binding domain-containing protein, partial [Streptosporangiaceae bacterium]|nr:SEC-C metal-binding domain-containing protein [Streptosporangiaceae bacterium]